jgi:integrase
MKILTINRSSKGYPLRKPLILKIRENQNTNDEKLQHYIIDTFSARGIRLAQFTFDNASTIEIAKHFLFHMSGSQKSLYQTIYALERFCRWLDTQPDQIIGNCLDENGSPKPAALTAMRSQIDDFIAYQQGRKLSPDGIRDYVRSIKALFRQNGINLELPYVIRVFSIYEYRALTREEIQKILNVANLRERVIISMLAVGGFRIGTLARLKYRHVKLDLERHIIPLNVQVESDVTKGRYRSYYTFLNQEAAEYLQAYVDARRIGTEKIPPEEITDESPLIGHAKRRIPASVTPEEVQSVIRNLYFKAGLIKRNTGCKRYDIRVHSLRKFFRTELSSRGVDSELVEFMMGHRINRYNDVKMKGVEYLRGIYLTAGLSIRPKADVGKIDALKEIICSWGLDPKKILKRKALTEFNETNMKAQEHV